MMQELKAEIFVRACYVPADLPTQNYVESLVSKLIPNVRPTSRVKYSACLSDFLFAVTRAPNGLIAWRTGDEQFEHSLYKRLISETVRSKLLEIGSLVIVQGGRYGLCIVYKANIEDAPLGLKFKKANGSSDIRVRAAKEKREWQADKKGKLIPIKRFQPGVQQLIDDMAQINRVLEVNQLSSGDGIVGDSCFRQFNEGRLDRGGRLYGTWQNLKKTERLKLTISSEDVCEIDIKACYLFLANQLSGQRMQLGADPYQRVAFVNGSRDSNENASMRELAKILVSAIFFKTGELTKFPRSQFKNASQRVISLKERFGLPQSASLKQFTGPIYEAFPFLSKFGITGGELMFRESELIVKTMLDLATREPPIPSYPVHDCLLCRVKDEDDVISALSQQMLVQLGGVASMEVTYRDRATRIITSGASDDPGLTTSLQIENDDTEFDVIEDWPKAGSVCP